ncbi:hypothetical protein JB92DRAFT_2826332 [Gautieria morchelliformis]|nr:hypothetical protein JB92DRAFT_2826332 [Gautieria morchelliformis]
MTGTHLSCAISLQDDQVWLTAIEGGRIAPFPTKAIRAVVVDVMLCVHHKPSGGIVIDKESWSGSLWWKPELNQLQDLRDTLNLITLSPPVGHATSPLNGLDAICTMQMTESPQPIVDQRFPATPFAPIPGPLQQLVLALEVLPQGAALCSPLPMPQGHPPQQVHHQEFDQAVDPAHYLTINANMVKRPRDNALAASNQPKQCFGHIVCTWTWSTCEDVLQAMSNNQTPGEVLNKQLVALLISEMQGSLQETPVQNICKALPRRLEPENGSFLKLHNRPLYPDVLCFRDPQKLSFILQMLNTH